MAGEQKIQAITTPAQMTDGVWPALIDERKVGLQVGTAHPLHEILRDADLAAGRARDVDQIGQAVTDAVGRDVGGGFREVGMRHSGRSL